MVTKNEKKYRGSPTVRKQVNLYLNKAMVERAKKARINISALAEKAIKQEIAKIKKKQGERKNED